MTNTIEQRTGTTSPARQGWGRKDRQERGMPQHHDTPMLDELEKGPWPSFISGLKRLATDDNPMMIDLLGQLEHSYETRLGYWKGGTVGVLGYGGGVIPRFSEVADKF